MFHSVIFKARNILWLSGCCKSRSGSGLSLDSRFRSIYRNFRVSEMPAVQFSNCGNQYISFEHKCNEKMNGTSMCIYLDALQSEECLHFLKSVLARNLLCVFSNYLTHYLLGDFSVELQQLASQ